jgi:SAM-dependent methyltransferase
MTDAEFDQYAQGYDAGMEHPWKRWAGDSRTAYLQPKLDWLGRVLKQWRMTHGIAEADLRVLEVGCGDGVLLRGVRAMGFTGALTGCDVSIEMIRVARAQAVGAEAITWDVSETAVLPYGACSFDVAVLCAVLHHVSPAERAAFMTQVRRTLRPGGLVCIMEHNPWNPVTQYVVSTTPIDADAKLLSHRAVRRLLAEAGIQPGRVEHILFVPPRLRTFAKLERWLTWLPMGGQYVVSGTLPDGSSAD